MTKYIFTTEDLDGDLIRNYAIESNSEQEAVDTFLKNVIPIINPVGINSFFDLSDFLDTISVRINIINLDEIKVLK